MKKFLFFIFLSLCFPVWADLLTEREWALRQIARTLHLSPLLIAMFLTAIVETFLLWCLRYRGWKILTYFFILNLISNAIVNIIYNYVWTILPSYGWSILMLESGVILFEFALLGLMVKYTWKLSVCVFLTNLTSFLLGLVLFGFPY